jgi:hypothetical protein
MPRVAIRANQKGEFIMPDTAELLPQLLRFRPWPNGDPIAPWLVDQLDKNQLVSLAAVGLELNQSVLQAQLKANTQALAIIKGTQAAK